MTLLLGPVDAADPAAASNLGGATRVTRKARREANRGAGLGRRILGWLLLGVAIVLLWPAQFGGITGLTVVNGRSMEPGYRTGDLIISIRQPSYAVGDVVSFQVPEGQAGAGGRVIHRIVEVGTVDGRPQFTSQGDNNPRADAWRFGAQDVLGRAVLRVPGAGGWLAPGGSPLLLAIALGAVVTLLLWGEDRPPRHRDDPDETSRR